MVNFSSLKPFKVVCMGDFMFDLYTLGKVKRISPEAPVPILEAISQESRPGGAGNVALNLAALGGQVFAIGRVGKDKEGQNLQALLSSKNIDASGFIEDPDSKTIVKNRLIADSQQLLRIDFETLFSLTQAFENKVIEKLKKEIPKQQIVAISDYGKGFLTTSLLQKTIGLCKEANIPSIIDPKGIDFTKYRGATVLKPNLSEAYAAARLPFSASLDQVASTLLQITQVELLLITRSEAGMSLFTKSGKRTDFPIQSREVKDVTGAGDTVLAVISLAIANSLDMETGVQLANIAAGLSIEKLGCVQITLPEIASRMQ